MRTRRTKVQMIEQANKMREMKAVRIDVLQAKPRLTPSEWKELDKLLEERMMQKDKERFDRTKQTEMIRDIELIRIEFLLKKPWLTEGEERELIKLQNKYGR